MEMTALRKLPIGMQNFVTDVRQGNIVRIGINFDSKTRNIDKVSVG